MTFSTWSKRESQRFLIAEELIPSSSAHLAIPTTVIVDDRRLRVGSVMIMFETLSQSAIVRDVHVFDGPSRIAEHNSVNLTGSVGFARFDVPAHPHVSLGIGISVGVSFTDAASALTMRFVSARCDFIP